MKTPKDFDYDIWKDDDGHYFIRVKRTGEVTRVSEEVVCPIYSCRLRIVRTVDIDQMYGSVYR